MPHNKQEVSFLDDFCFVCSHMVSAMRASQKAYFPLAEWAFNIRTPENVKMIQAFPSFVGKSITNSHPFQEALPP
jgi:hypothetical protein